MEPLFMFNPNHIRLLCLILVLSISQEQSAHPIVAIAAVKAAAAAGTTGAAKGSFIAIIKTAVAKFGFAGATKAVGGKAVAAVTTQALAATASTTTATAISANASIAVAVNTTAAVATKVSSAAVAAVVQATGAVVVTTSAFLVGGNGPVTRSTDNQSSGQPSQNDLQDTPTQEQVQKTFDEKVDELWVVCKEQGIKIARGMLIGKVLDNTFDCFTGEKARAQKEKETTEIYRDNVDMLNNEIRQLRETSAKQQQQIGELVIEIRKMHDVLISMKKG